MANQNKINKLMNDKDFVDKIINMETKEEVKNEFLKHKINLFDDELNDLGDLIYELSEQFAELSVDELNDISAAGGAESPKGNIAKIPLNVVKGIHGSISGGFTELGDYLGEKGNIFSKHANSFATGVFAGGVALMVMKAIYGFGKKMKWWGHKKIVIDIDK